MKSYISHIQINIKQENNSFYKELFKFLGFEVLMDFEMGTGYKNSVDKTSVWTMHTTNTGTPDYDLTGVNHIGFAANTIEEVDEIAKWLKSKNIPALFDTPRHRPEFSGEDETYYQVMFETPDKLLFEIVYTGKK